MFSEANPPTANIPIHLTNCTLMKTNTLAFHCWFAPFTPGSSALIQDHSTLVSQLASVQAHLLDTCHLSQNQPPEDDS